MKKEFTHQLVESFKYSYEGQFHDAELITVTAPKTEGFYDNLQFLDSLCTKAEMRTLKNLAGLLKELEQNEVAQQTDERPEEDRALDSYNQIMSGLEQAEIKQLNLAILELLKKSAMVDGTKKFEESFWQELGMEDRRFLIGKYILNFTVTAQRNSRSK